MLYYSKESDTGSLSGTQIKTAVREAIAKAAQGRKLIIIPPDITRIHSQAGIITEMIWDHFKENITDILPAIGTHKPITAKEIKTMFGSVPANLFREHKWRSDIITLGEVPGDYLESVSGGRLNYSWPVQINNLLNRCADKLIISVGQVVPHEVIGMANHNKNIFIGCGGPEAINKSHFLGAVYGMERIMGKANSPVREVLNFGESAYASHLNILYILTVIGKDNKGKLCIKGLYIGDDPQCFHNACELSGKINITRISKPLNKVVVYLHPLEYRSTWLGNKAIYRTRMAMADNGELIIIGPGIESFGEDDIIDTLIRKYGYRTSEEILRLTNENKDLANNLGVAAHLIHGSPENRFNVTYSPGKLSRQEIEGAWFNYSPLEETIGKYKPDELKDGFNTLAGGDEFYFISNPALGLWTSKKEHI